uniref:Uncharacterized protein n=1 Tax=Rhizophora mucronata TaxID=61149 RepID=A0A2P2NRJ4_RHIMU
MLEFFFLFVQKLSTVLDLQKRIRS